MIKNLVFDFGGIIADFEFSRALAAFERVGLKNPAEYLDSWRISEIVHKYSDYIAYPIVMAKESTKEDGSK